MKLPLMSKEPQDRAEALARAERQAHDTLRVTQSALRQGRGIARASDLISLEYLVVDTQRDLRMLRSGFDRERLAGTHRAVADFIRANHLRPEVHRHLADLFADLLALEAVSDGACDHSSDGVVERSGLCVATSLLCATRRAIFPPERMVVGAVRRRAGARVLEAIYDVTGKANGAHVDPDPDKLMAAFVDMDATETLFGFWGHSHPGSGPTATTPSWEDQRSYAKRLASGDSRDLVGAIFAGRHVGFFGQTKNMRLLGPGLRQNDAAGDIYEFDTA